MSWRAPETSLTRRRGGAGLMRRASSAASNVLVNNASELGGIGPLATFDVQRFGRVFPVNTGAPIALIQSGVAAARRASRPHREHHERRRTTARIPAGVRTAPAKRHSNS